MNTLQTLFLLPLVVACISWTVTQEEVFREPREFCVRHSKTHPKWYCRKFAYLFTCQYCFSHWVTALTVLLTGFKLFSDGPQGYFFAGFAMVALANLYMTVYSILRQTFRVLSKLHRAEVK